MNEVFSVSGFVALLNQTLEFAFPAVAVEGEVSSFKVNQGKWVFFDLKDDESSISCFMSVYQLKVPLEDGMKIKVVAAPKLTKWGKFSITVKEIELTGEGTLKRAYELLRQKFESEGLFALEHKRELSHYPSRIALITSAQAAAYNDFLKIVTERWPYLRIDHYQVQVQGIDAPAQIAAALTYCNNSGVEYNALVLIRGGGSLEDLAAFSSETVVRAVFGSRWPTLVAIGHEDDISLAELAADVRGATPTDAARLLCPDRGAIKFELSQVQSALVRACSRHVEQADQVLVRFGSAVQTQITRSGHSLELLTSTMTKNACSFYDRCENRLRFLQTQLNLLDPRKILKRGFSITSHHGAVVTQESQVKVGEELVIQLWQGKIEAKRSK